MGMRRCWLWVKLPRNQRETGVHRNPVPLISSIHPYNTRQSQIDNLFVKSVHTTQYSICSLSYTGLKLWNSLSINVTKIKPFSSPRQYIKNSVIDDILVWVTYLVTSTNYLGVPNSAQWPCHWKFIFLHNLSTLYLLKALICINYYSVWV